MCHKADDSTATPVSAPHRYRYIYISISLLADPHPSTVGYCCAWGGGINQSGCKIFGNTLLIYLHHCARHPDTDPTTTLVRTTPHQPWLIILPLTRLEGAVKLSCRAVNLLGVSRSIHGGGGIWWHLHILLKDIERFQY